MVNICHVNFPLLSIYPGPFPDYPDGTFMVVTDRKHDIKRIKTSTHTSITFRSLPENKYYNDPMGMYNTKEEIFRCMIPESLLSIKLECGNCYYIEDIFKGKTKLETIMYLHTFQVMINFHDLM